MTSLTLEPILAGVGAQLALVIEGSGLSSWLRKPTR